MFERFRRGWGIAKASWAVLKLHPKLLLLPLASSAALIVLLGAIAISAYSGSQGGPGNQLFMFLDRLNPEDPMIYVYGFLLYFTCAFVVIFFNAALVFCALEAFAGRTPTLRGGLATAVGRLPQILAWTFVAATIGLLLNALHNFLRDRLGFLGSLLGGLLEVAWAVITYFVVPVLVVDGVGPVEAVKRSSAILKRTWGESVGIEAGLGIVSFVLTIPIILLVMVASMAAGSAAVVMWSAVGVYLIVVSAVLTSLGTIFRTGAYIYATTGKAPSAMDPALLQGAFRRKE